MVVYLNRIRKALEKELDLLISFYKINDIEGYIEKLEAKAKYKKLDNDVKTNVKYVIRVYFRFFEQRKQNI